MQNLPLVPFRGVIREVKHGEMQQSWSFWRVTNTLFLLTSVAVAVIATGINWSGNHGVDAHANRMQLIQSMIIDETGTSASQIHAAQIVDGLMVERATGSSGKAIDTFVQQQNSSVSVFAVLNEGETSARFSGLFGTGLHLNPVSDGGLEVVDNAGQIQSKVAAPWATDATGKRLQTSYSVDGTDIVQHVATGGAVYPIVADPNVSLGLSGITPVYRIRFTWTETNKINVELDRDGIEAALGLLCGLVPHPVAKVACGIVVVLAYPDLKNNIKSAIKNKKCLQVQVPVSPLVPPTLSGYDASVVKCSS